MIDTHVHSLASTHAYSSIEEIVKAGAQKGVEGFVLTDHSPGMPGGAHIYHFYNLRILPREIQGVKIFRGAEANICSWDGEIDMDEEVLSELEVVIASFHPPILEPGSKENHTAAYLKVMENPQVHIIGHPDDSRYSFEIEPFVKKAGETGTFIEINNSSFLPTSVRAGALERYKSILTECKKQGVSVTLGSDSHFSGHLGRLDSALELIKELDFPMELVANRNLPAFLEAFHLEPVL